jgi:hypothetical protein
MFQTLHLAVLPADRHPRARRRIHYKKIEDPVLFR